MPLIQNGRSILRASLEMLAQGEKPLVVTIGYLTMAQHATISEYRLMHGLPGLASPEIVFLGRHLHHSRAIKDGYSIDDIIDQIESAIADTALVIATHKMTALKSSVARSDRYGNQVIDEAVFELTQRRPKAELYSVIPKGDKNKPPRP